MKGFIYCIENCIDKNKYIGKTIKNVEKRFQYHINSANRGDEYPLQRAIRKYEIKNFKIFILEIIEAKDKKELKDRLNILEIKWIAKLNTFKGIGYNASRGGDGGGLPGKDGFMYGKKHSEKTKRKMREGKFGGDNPAKRPEVRAKISIALKRLYSNRENCPRLGKHHSEETKRKIGDANRGGNNGMFGKIYTEEMRGKVSGKNNGMYGKKHSEETKKRIGIQSKKNYSNRIRNSKGQFISMDME